MKKFLALIFLALALTVVFSACSAKTDDVDETTSAVITEETTTEKSEEKVFATEKESETAKIVEKPVTVKEPETVTPEKKPVTRKHTVKTTEKTTVQTPKTEAPSKYSEFTFPEEGYELPLDLS